jgi:hypothetical protein
MLFAGRVNISSNISKVMAKFLAAQASCRPQVCKYSSPVNSRLPPGKQAGESGASQAADLFIRLTLAKLW